MKHTAALRFAVAFLLSGGLSACGAPDNLGQPFKPKHKPGTYSGKKDQKLSEKERKELRERSLLKAGR